MQGFIVPMIEKKKAGADKRLVAGPSNYQLEPMQYPYLYEQYKNLKQLDWVPGEINMTDDQASFRLLTDYQRHTFVNTFATLSTMDVQAPDILSNLIPYITAPEAKAFPTLQAAGEFVHTETYRLAIEQLQLGDGIWDLWQTVPAIKNKITFAQGYLLPTGLDLSNKDDLEVFLMAYLFLAGIFEGTYFYSGFNPIFALSREAAATTTPPMYRTVEQLQYIIRDEAAHAGFGLNLIKLIAEENNFKWNLNMVRTMFLEAYELEQDYIKFILPTPLLSYNQTTHMQYVQYLMNLRCIRAGLPVIFPEFDMRTHPVPWAGEMIEVKKEKNFFETRVTEYRSGSSLDFGEHVDWEKKRAELATKDAMYHLGYTRNKKPTQ